MLDSDVVACVFRGWAMVHATPGSGSASACWFVGVKVSEWEGERGATPNVSCTGLPEHCWPSTKSAAVRKADGFVCHGPELRQEHSSARPE